MTIPQANDLVHDPIAFAEHMLMVWDMSRKLVPLQYKSAQEHYLANRTSRDLIVKARKLGFSTAIQAEGFRLYTTSPQAMLTMADKQDNTDKLRRMAEHYYEYLPPRFPKPIRSEANASITAYPKVGSIVEIATAGGKTSGRGGTYTIFHGSEVAYWRNAEWAISGALQAVPEHVDDTWVVFESTGNGTQGWFFEECMAALGGNSEWTLHFYAWWWETEYKINLLPDETIIYTEEESALANKHSLSPEQIKWRRKKQRDLKERFQQEHPESVMQAFITTGGGVFTITQDNILSDSIQQKNISGGYKIWHGEYVDGHIYVMGIDWGQSNDFTVASVFDATGYKKVAMIRLNKQSYAVMCSEIVALAQEWHVEKIMPEKNSMSAAIEILTGQLWSADWGMKDGYSAEPVVELFNMNNQKKSMLVTLFSRGLDDGLMLLDDDNSLNEIRAFETQQTPTGLYKYTHPKGGHDDTVIADMLANKACYEMR